MTSASPTPPPRVAPGWGERLRRAPFDLRALALAVLVLVGANALFNSIASEFRAPSPLTTFLGVPNDRHGDLIKFAVAFPGPAFRHVEGWNPLFQRYYYRNSYTSSTLENISRHGVLPLTKSLYHGVRWLIYVGGPGTAIALFAAALLAPILWLVRTSLQTPGRRFFLLLLWLFNYPVLFLLFRGNVGAAVTGCALIGAVSYAFRGVHPLRAMALLAVAANVRPNCAVFAALLFAYGGLRGSFRYLVGWACLTPLLFFACLRLGHAVDPAYTSESMRAGIREYYGYYVLGDLGLGGSTLWVLLRQGAILLHFPPPPDINPVLTALFALGAFGTVLLYLRQRLSLESLLLLLSLLYALASAPVVADYHMIVFFSLFLVWAIQEERHLPTSSFRVERWALCLVWAPKSYLYFHGISVQGLLNPLILLFVLGWHAFFVLRRRPAAVPADLLAGSEGMAFR